MSIKHILLAAALAAPLAMPALPASAASVEVKALASAPIYRWHSSNSRTIGQLKKGKYYTIDYCTPPDADWCRIVGDDLHGWVRGYELANGAKKAFVTPFRFGGGSLMMKPL